MFLINYCVSVLLSMFIIFHVLCQPATERMTVGGRGQPKNTEDIWELELRHTDPP